MEQNSYTAVNFINVLRANFLYKILAPKITKSNVIRGKLLNSLLNEKQACKILIKLTPGGNRIKYI
jgi:hypothetical protein